MKWVQAVTACLALTAVAMLSPLPAKAGNGGTTVGDRNPGGVLVVGEEGTTGLSPAVVAGVFAIRDSGPAHSPETYAGVGTEVPSTADTLVIALTNRAAEIEERFVAASGLPRDKVEFVTVHTPESEFAGLDQRLLSDWVEWSAQGIDIANFGMGGDHEYTIAVHDLKESDRARLQASYGSVEVVNEEVHPDRGALRRRW